MAYGLKYYFAFDSENGKSFRIEILKDGYSGASYQRALGKTPVLKKESNGPMRGTSLELYAECKVDQEFSEFYTSDPLEYRVDVYSSSVLIWRGFISPELYSEPDVAPPYDVQIIATDGLGELKFHDYVAQGKVTLQSQLQYLLGNTGVGTSLSFVSDIQAKTASGSTISSSNFLASVYVDFDFMADDGKNCYEVLEYILETLNATITWYQGVWKIRRETNTTSANMQTASIGSIGSSNWWPVGNLSTKIIPAKNRIAVQAPWHTQDGGIYDANMEALPATTRYSGWFVTDPTGSGGGRINHGPNYYLFIAPERGALSKYLESYDTEFPADSVKTMKFRYSGSNEYVKLYVTIGMTLGSTTKWLKFSEGSSSGGTWEDGSMPSYTAYGDVTQYTDDPINANELEIEIPRCWDSTAHMAVLSIYINRYPGVIGGERLWLYYCNLSPIVGEKGYEDVLTIQNSAREGAEDVEIAFGRTDLFTNNGYYSKQRDNFEAIPWGSTSPCVAFKDSHITSECSFLSFITKDYGLSIAAPRISKNGRINVPSSASNIPEGFLTDTYYALLDTFSWELLTDELEIEIISLPSVTMTIESEVIRTTKKGSTGGGSSSSGSGGGGGQSSGIAGIKIDGATSHVTIGEDRVADIDLDGYLAENDYATEDYVDGKETAIKAWVEGKGYATEDYVDDKETSIKAWVEGKGYAVDTTIKAWVEAKEYAVDATIKAWTTAITGNKSVLTTSDKSTLVNAINEVNSIARGATQALVYADYESLLNDLSENDSRIIGQSLLIVAENVPDLWIIEKDIIEAYEYTSDEQFIEDVKNGVNIWGYYLSFLETQKVDLSDYYTKTQSDNLLADKVSKAGDVLSGNFRPDGDNTRDLGNASYRFANMFAKQLRGVDNVQDGNSSKVVDTNDNNRCTFGGGCAENSKDVNYDGCNIHFRVSTTHEDALVAGSDKTVEVKRRLKIGNAYLEWDSAAQALKIIGDVYATGNVATGGPATDAGSVLCLNGTTYVQSAGEVFKAYICSDAMTMTINDSAPAGRHFRVYDQNGQLSIIRSSNARCYIYKGDDGGMDVVTSSVINLGESWGDYNPNVWDFLFDGTNWHITGYADTY